MSQTPRSKKSKKKKEQPVPFHRKPDGMTIEKWQMLLRKQFVGTQDFVIEKQTPELVFADYQVFNPATKNTYKVALRSSNHDGDNFCNCYDFRISRLGTCKHIEAVFGFITKKRLKKHLKTPEIRQYSSVYLHYKHGKQVMLRIGTNQLEAFVDLSLEYFDDQFVLTDYGLAHFERFLQKARSLDADFRCYEDALEHILDEREHQRRIQKVQKMLPQKQQEWLSGLVKTQLFPYQQEAVLFSYQHGKVIVGDEMGLGKTIQAIATVELMRRELGISKVLILAPTSLKYQWKTEIAKFAGQDAEIVEGGPNMRHKIHRQSEAVYRIASYHANLFDFAVVADAGYDLVILDEAQRIKNWRTKIAQSVRRIHTRYTLVLTGTPVENNLEELYGLVQFVDPFALGPRHSFFPRYQTTDGNGRVVGYENLGEIRQLLANRLIRRTKKQVLTQLPKRTDKNLVVPMTQPQREMHREFADQVAKLVVKWHRLKFLDEQDRQKLLKNLNLMRMVCDSTYIVDQTTNHQVKVDELCNILSEILEIEGEKVVVFSQWARMNDLVAKALEDMGVVFRYLHGGVPGKDRGALYHDFNTDPTVRIFLSTDAGGVGLNLQSAAWLINLDIPWNPGTLEQRIGRIYRLGQEKPVNVINLISEATIEHNLLGVLQFKKSMAAGVLDDGEDTIFMGESKFKQFMASVETITVGTTNIVAAAPEEVSEPETHPGEAVIPDAAYMPEPLLEAHTEPESTDDLDPSEGFIPVPSAPVNNDLQPEKLVQNGMQLLSQFARTLNDTQATEKLVKSIVHKDESGQTYVKLPVENEQAVLGIFQMLGSLLKSMNS
jgi:SNF2 family DNA or RNA helicase